MPRLDSFPEVSRNRLLTLPVPVNDTAPFTPLRKPLSECTIAIVTTAGLHLRDDKPFLSGDPSYRVIPSTSPAGQIIESHASIGFDRVPAMRDLNIVYPIDRLNELVQRGDLGSIGAKCYSFMGAQTDTSRIERGTAPEVARALLDQGVDAVLLTPT
ncbi:MAG: glycine/sarcosine/betaine reductase selenoprotein B family protein [Dehalococcoidia bacterium]